MKKMKLLPLLTFFFVLLAFTSCEQTDDAVEMNGMEGKTLTMNRAYTVEDVTEFNWITGNQEWRQPSKDRLWSSQFTFKSNDEFIYQFDYSTNFFWHI